MSENRLERFLKWIVTAADGAANTRQPLAQSGVEQLEKISTTINEKEARAHHLLSRLQYLLARLEEEFFHVQPDVTTNGETTSLALCSILNEAVNIQEAAFAGDFFQLLKAWGRNKPWQWNAVQVRFVWGPACESFLPFEGSSDEKLFVRGRQTNNDVKHQGALASLSDTICACAVAWFLVMEIAQESGVYVTSTEADRLFSLFDCYDLIRMRSDSFGYIICRPVHNMQSYPHVRGASEKDAAKAAYAQRFASGELAGKLPVGQ